MIESLVAACQFILTEQGEPQSSYWLSSQIMEMKLWRASEADVREALTKDIAKHGESSRFVSLADDEFALRSWSTDLMHEGRGEKMKRPLPRTAAQWFKEIKLAIADAAKAAPFGPLVGTNVTDANLFHLAPMVCLKFRGKKLKGREADRVIQVALANYVANTDADGIDHALEQRPLMAFTLCYVAAHLALDFVDEQQAEAILTYCEEHF